MRFTRLRVSLTDPPRQERPAFRQRENLQPGSGFETVCGMAQFVHSPRCGTRKPQTTFAFLFESPYELREEDCLRLNVWSPGLGGASNRPQLVWLHGGGFFGGSGSEFPAYDGRNLAARGEVVVVSINHRLNVLGFLNLSEFGERYADSANVGMLDVVAALGWVRQNIERFGGNPENVTVFGQSGGGAKVNY